MKRQANSKPIKAMWCKPWELAEERGLQFHRRFYNGNVNGAITFCDGNEVIADFAVVAERGIYATYEEQLELISGEWDNETPSQDPSGQGQKARR